MVDQSLLRQAADRGVTICFADLDGADGLWVPEERTILVSRGLSEAKVAEVIEHELAHVMIDDQHADLDAGKEVLVGRPPSRYRRPQTVALAAVSLFVVVGGALYGVNMARDGAKADQVAPNRNGPGLSADESRNGTPSPKTTVTKGPDGVWHTIVVTESASPPTATTSRTGAPQPSATATATNASPQPSRSATASPPPAQPTRSASPPVQPTSDPPPTTPAVDPTTPVLSTPPVESGGAGGGGTGDGTGDAGDTGDQNGIGGGIDTGPVGGGIDTGPVGTEPANATVADVPVPPAPGDTATP